MLMTDAKINSGVALLLERMKTNPEEFTQDHKWLGVIRSYKEYLNEEDRKVLDAGINELMQQKFTETVLEELVDPKSVKSKWGDSSITHSAGVTHAQSILNTLGVKHTTIEVDTPSIKQAITTLEEIKKEYETQKKPKTIFGRLFNYQ
jgi:hypothetical protein